MFTVLAFLAACPVAIDSHRFRVHYGPSLIDFYNATFVESFKRGFLFNAFLDITDSQSANIRCVDHLRKVKEGLLSLTPWALKHASGEFQTFSSTGNLINLGSYHECLKIHTDQFKGQSCKIKIIFNESPAQNASLVPHNVPLVFTFCSPNSCTPSDLMALLTSTDLNTTYAIDCSTESNPSYTMPRILSLCVFVGICLFLVLAIAVISSTTYDIFAATNHEGLNNLLCSFSIKRNNAVLFNNDSSSIPSINGMRYLCQLIVVFFHYWLHLLKNDLPVVDKFELNEIAKSWKGSVIINLCLVVDVFFSITGFILSFTFLKNGSPALNTFRMCARRYLRLFPAYLAVVFLMSTIFDKMCEGPLCAVQVTRNYQLCQQYWWTNVIGINNFYPGLLNSCLPSGWYVAADLQIFVVLAPLTMYLMRSSIKATYSVLAFLTAWSVLVTFMISVSYELPLDNFEFDAEKYAVFRTLHSAPYVRVKSWAVGVIMGMYTHSFTSKGNSYPGKVVLWLICGLSLILTTGPTFIIHHTFNSSVIASALVTSTQGVLISLSTCCIIFASSMKFGGVVNNFLEWSPLVHLSKLSYCLYIVHMPILYIFFGSVRAPIDSSLAMQLPFIIGVYVINHFASWALFVTVEMPAIHITGHFFTKK